MCNILCYFSNCCQTLKMNTYVESFPYPDKQGTPEEGRRIQRPKRCATTNNNKDEAGYIFCIQLHAIKYC